MAKSDKERERDQDRLREAMSLMDGIAHLPLKHDEEHQRAVKMAWQGVTDAK